MNLKSDVMSNDKEVQALENALKDAKRMGLESEERKLSKNVENRSNVIDKRTCQRATTKPKQLTIQQSFARQPLQSREANESESEGKETLRLYIPDKPVKKEEVVFKKPALPSGMNRGNHNKSRKTAKNLLRFVETPPPCEDKSDKKRKLTPVWSTFNKVPKVEAIKTAKPFNFAAYKFIQPADSVIVTPEKKLTLFEPTHLKLHKRDVDRAGGAANAWHKASFFDKPE